MNRFKVLIVGGGGREHALAWKMAQSERVAQIFVAPGNAGTAGVATNVAIKDSDIDGLLEFAQKNEIGLTMVGPEVPLSLGIVDRFNAQGLPIYGPSQAAAQLESSKAFSKAFMERHGIPTARFAAFREFDAALAYLDKLPESGVVVKASGLAAGKGVIVCDDLAQGREALREIMLDQQFGAAGGEVVIEERLDGVEVSLLAFCDGKTAVPMVPARDHKRIFEGDKGPNTGGMGAFAPVPDLDDDFVARMTQDVLQKTVDGMAADGIPYVGILYAGLMLTAGGVQVLEFNCRFGDPETQVILPLLESDLVAVIERCLDGELCTDDVVIRDGAAATVVMAAPGYPGGYPKGLVISGVEIADGADGTDVFHAGTALVDGELVTSGGRVLAVSATGVTLDEALERAYEGVQKIGFEGAQVRGDIGRTID